jgi:hypothetical protein
MYSLDLHKKLNNCPHITLRIRSKINYQFFQVESPVRQGKINILAHEEPEHFKRTFHICVQVKRYRSDGLLAMVVKSVFVKIKVADRTKERHEL